MNQATVIENNPTTEKTIKLNIPQSNGNNEYEVKHSLVIVGANGSGKSRLGYKFDFELSQKYRAKMHIQRITAQRNIQIPDSTTLSFTKPAENNLLYGHHHQTYTDEQMISKKPANKWGNRAVKPLSDYDKLLSLLFAKHNEISNQYMEESSSTKDKVPVPQTPIHKLEKIWSKLLPKRKIKFDGDKGVVNAYFQDANPYHGREMSDGERVILYMLGQCLCMPKNSIIIIDEPEIHIHKAIVNKLWDIIEEERIDCIFIYITHDLEFATARKNAQKIWLKSYDGNLWEWQEVPKVENLPEKLVLEILGSRKNILFVEGDKDSLDNAIYEAVFPDFTIIPCGGCGKVIEATKAYKTSLSMHHYTAYGIVDRDFRQESQIEAFKNDDNIHTIDVAEIENLLCLRGVIKFIVEEKKYPDNDKEKKLTEVIDFVIKVFNENSERQISTKTIRKIKSKIESIPSNANSLEEITKARKEYLCSINEEEIYQKHKEHCEKLIQEKDYEGILKLYNDKGLFKRISSEIFKDTDLKGYIKRCLSDPKSKEKLVNALKAYLPDLPVEECKDPETSSG